jgi:DNA-binding transcriptional LysR family regulator
MGSVELRHFRYFVAVAEERHFGKAAARLHIAQPGLSQQIKRLERSVGAQLLVRGPRGVELTEAGTAFLDQARLALDFADRAVASALLAQGGKKGLLRVGAPALAIPPVAEGVLQEFGARFPDVEVEVHPAFHPQLIEELSTHALDVAIVLSPFRSVVPAPRFMPLGTLEVVVVVPVGHRLAGPGRVPRSELLTEPFLDWPRTVNPEMVDHVHALLFETGEHPRTVPISELDEARRFALVAQGRGITTKIVFGLPGEHHAPGVVFRQFEEPVPYIEYGVAWASTQSSPHIPDFLDVARSFAPAEVASGPDTVGAGP